MLTFTTKEYQKLVNYSGIIFFFFSKISRQFLVITILPKKCFLENFSPPILSRFSQFLQNLYTPTFYKKGFIQEKWLPSMLTDNEISKVTITIEKFSQNMFWGRWGICKHFPHQLSINPSFKLRNYFKRFPRFTIPL